MEGPSLTVLVYIGVLSVPSSSSRSGHGSAEGFVVSHTDEDSLGTTVTM